VDVSADRNLRSGVRIRGNGGTVVSAVGTLNHRVGLEMGNDGSDDNVTKWVVHRVEFTDTGAPFGSVTLNDAGTSVQLNGVVNCQFGHVSSRDPLGYGLAVTRGNVLGSSRNQFGTVILDQSHSIDGDPGLHISGASAGNTFGHVSVKQHSFAVSFGEGVPGTPTDNVIETLTAVDCPYGIVRADVGTNNRVGPVLARNCYNTNLGVATALVWFTGAAVTGNVVGPFRHRTMDNPAPNLLFAQVSSAAGNSIVYDTLSGTGSPEGVVTAEVGTMYLRLDGSTSTTAYFKTSGSGNTGWTAK
jgi:hypothetical protein